MSEECIETDVMTSCFGERLRDKMLLKRENGDQGDERDQTSINWPLNRCEAASFSAHCQAEARFLILCKVGEGGVGVGGGVCVCVLLVFLHSFYSITKMSIDPSLLLTPSQQG